MEAVNCLRCGYKDADNGNCTAAGGFCTAVPAAYCPLLEDYLDTKLAPTEIHSLWGEWQAMLSVLNSIGSYERLRELAEADRDKRVAVLPCKPGDMLYEVTNRKTISEYRVTAICVTLGGLFLEWEIKRGFAGRSAIGIIPDWIGKTVFLTRAEAETALQQMEGENGIENSKSYPKKDESDGALRQ